MKEQPLVSIIVPVYNSSEYIQPFLTSLLKTTYTHIEILLIDDGSTDGTIEYIKTIKDSSIRLIQNKYRAGLTRSRNIGIRKAKGEYVAFAETDMLFDRLWLTEGIKTLAADVTLGAVTGKVLDMQKKNIIQTIGLKLIPQTTWVECVYFGKKDAPIFASQEVSMGAVGSIVKREVLEKIKGFDEVLTRNVEDIDFGFRIWIAGYRIISVPTSITYHVTIKDWGIRKKAVSQLQNDIFLSQVTRVILKNYEWQNVFIYFPQTILILFLRGCLNLAKGNIYPLLSFFYILYWTLDTLPSTMQERSSIQKHRGFSDKVIFNKIMIKESIPDLFNKFYLNRNYRSFTE